MVAFQVGELGGEEEEEAHDSTGDDPEDRFLQNPILKWPCWSEVGVLPVGVEYFFRIYVELVEEHTWKNGLVKGGNIPWRINPQASGEDGEGEGGADENELESGVGNPPVGKCGSDANLK